MTESERAARLVLIAVRARELGLARVHVERVEPVEDDDQEPAVDQLLAGDRS